MDWCSKLSIFKKGDKSKLFPDDLIAEKRGEDMSSVITAYPAYPVLSSALKGFPRSDDQTERERKKVL